MYFCAIVLTIFVNGCGSEPKCQLYLRVLCKMNSINHNLSNLEEYCEMEIYANVFPEEIWISAPRANIRDNTQHTKINALKRYVRTSRQVAYWCFYRISKHAILLCFWSDQMDVECIFNVSKKTVNLANAWSSWWFCDFFYPFELKHCITNHWTIKGSN